MRRLQFEVALVCAYACVGAHPCVCFMCMFFVGGDGGEKTALGCLPVSGLESLFVLRLVFV